MFNGSILIRSIHQDSPPFRLQGSYLSLLTPITVEWGQIFDKSDKKRKNYALKYHSISAYLNNIFNPELFMMT